MTNYRCFLSIGIYRTRFKYKKYLTSFKDDDKSIDEKKAKPEQSGDAKL